MSSSTNRTRTLTTLGILTAIILVMTFTPLGYIKTNDTTDYSYASAIMDFAGVVGS